MAATIQYDGTQAGKYYIATAQVVFVFDYDPTDGLFRSVGESAQGGKVQLTGYYIVAKSGKSMYQTISGVWVNLTDDSGWNYSYTASLPNASAKQAQGYVNTIIENNKRIVENNCICARFADKLTNKQKQDLYELQCRLEERNKQLQNDSLISSESEASPAGYNQLSEYLERFMKEQEGVSGVGVVVSTTVIIVVSAVVVAAMGLAAFFAYKAYAAESTADVKFSDKLTKTLCEKLTDEEYAQLMSETKGIVTKKTLAARFGSNAKWLLAAGSVILGGWLFYKYGKR